MPRFSDIKKGPLLNQYFQNYVNYWNTAATRTPGVNTRGDQPARDPLYVVPFEVETQTDEVIAVSAAATAIAAMQTLVNGVTGAEFFTASTGKTIISLAGWRPAAATWFRNAAKTKTTATSELTGSRYLRYAGERFTVPFGQQTATAKQITTFNAIKAALKAQSGFAVNRVSLREERITFKAS